MSRVIDTIPAPGHPLEKKVIVLSFGRNGTLGLYKAFKILGYNPYHFKTCFEKDLPDLLLMTEAIEAKYHNIGKPYGPEEFDKWFRDYDVITDVSAFFAQELAAAYPDAKFILTYRDTDAWLRSIHKTFLPLQKAQDQFPLGLMRRIEPFTRRFFRLTNLLTHSMWNGYKDVSSAAADKILVDMYKKHNQMAMNLVPPEKLLVVKLEDGLGWEQICPFLGVDIPREPYPHANDPKEFEKMVHGFMTTAWTRSFKRWAALWTPMIGIGIWYVLRRKGF